MRQRKSSVGLPRLSRRTCLASALLPSGSSPSCRRSPWRPGNRFPPASPGAPTTSFVHRVRPTLGASVVRPRTIGPGGVDDRDFSVGRPVPMIMQRYSTGRCRWSLRRYWAANPAPDERLPVSATGAGRRRRDLQRPSRPFTQTFRSAMVLSVHDRPGDVPDLAVLTL